LNAADNLAVTVVPKFGPPRLQLRLGPHRYTLTEPEALALADRLVDGVEQLTADITNTTKGTTP
jgi:hypothetical protein